MSRIEKLIEIKASPEKVWSLFRWERIPEWYAPFKKVVYTSKEKGKVGETVRITTENGEMDAVTTEMKENEKVVWRYTGGAFTGSETFAFTPIKDGTMILVSDILEYELPHSILGKIVDKLRVHKAIEKSIDAGLQKLKAMAEK